MVKHRRNEQAINQLAKNIRVYRAKKGMTIQQLANIINVDYSQISRIERGVVNTNISIVFDIAEALEVLPFHLLE